MELVKSRLLSDGSAWHIGSLSAVYLSQGLSGGTLFALTTYLVSIGASVGDISLLLSITMVPWTLKVFLGPLIDSFTVKKFGKENDYVIKFEKKQTKNPEIKQPAKTIKIFKSYTKYKDAINENPITL